MGIATSQNTIIVRVRSASSSRSFGSPSLMTEFSMAMSETTSTTIVPRANQGTGADQLAPLQTERQNESTARIRPSRATAWTGSGKPVRVPSWAYAGR
jgi:hypothetical protein